MLNYFHTEQQRMVSKIVFIFLLSAVITASITYAFYKGYKEKVDEVPSLKVLTLEAVKELSEKGEALSWEDFDNFDGMEIGSGLYIRKYPINSEYMVLIGGKSLKEKPTYISLFRTQDEGSIDIRYEDVNAFIK